MVSIPFEQGDVFRQEQLKDAVEVGNGLNPFRTGRCLSTYYHKLKTQRRVSLNPFRTGRCLSTEQEFSIRGLDNLSQSLSNRAMSFDRGRSNCLQAYLVSIPFEQGDVFRHIPQVYLPGKAGSQSLSNRAMSFDCSCMLVAGIMRSFRPTSQFFWKVKELALDLSK